MLAAVEASFLAHQQRTKYPVRAAAFRRGGGGVSASFALTMLEWVRRAKTLVFRRCDRPFLRPQEIEEDRPPPALHNNSKRG